MNHLKRIFGSLLVIGALAAVVSGGTFASFTAQATNSSNKVGAIRFKGSGDLRFTVIRERRSRRRETGSLAPGGAWWTEPSSWGERAQFRAGPAPQLRESAVRQAGTLDAMARSGRRPMQTGYSLVDIWPGIALLAVFTVLTLLIMAGARATIR